MIFNFLFGDEATFIQQTRLQQYYKSQTLRCNLPRTNISLTRIKNRNTKLHISFKNKFFNVSTPRELISNIMHNELHICAMPDSDQINLSIVNSGISINSTLVDSSCSDYIAIIVMIDRFVVGC